MIAAKRAVSEEEKRKTGDNTAPSGSGAGAKASGVAGDKGRDSKGEELKKSGSEGGDGSEGGEEREEGEEEEEWEQVGPKNKSTITRQVCTCTCMYTCMLDSFTLKMCMCTCKCLT